VVDTWRELVASLNDTHVLHPDDLGRRAALRMQDFVAIDASLVCVSARTMASAFCVTP
jgi:hypothetical protein